MDFAASANSSSFSTLILSNVSLIFSVIPQLILVEIYAQARNRAKFIKYFIDEIKVGIIKPHLRAGHRNTRKRWIKLYSKAKILRLKNFFPGPWVHNNDTLVNSLMYTVPS